MPFSPLSGWCRTRLLPLLAALALAGAPNARAVTELPKLLQNGFPLTKVAVPTGDGIVFRIAVPEGAKNLVFRCRGGTGDCDLYVKRGAHPTIENAEFFSNLDGNREELTIEAPEAGPWYVLAYAARGFQGVDLTARYVRSALSQPVPQLIGVPGVYPGKATVGLRVRGAKSPLYYTIDGSEPTSESLLYRRPLVFESSTRLRVRAFPPGKPPGPLVEADYFIQAPGTATALAGGVALRHLAGMQGRNALFKISIPEGQKRLDILTEGGSGQSDFLVRHGAPPTAALFDAACNGPGNAASFTLKNPEGGDWFILLRARTNFSRCTLMASSTGFLPDLIVWAAALEPYLSVERFAGSDCEVAEGMISAGTHTLLRFTTETRNVGGSDLVMPPIFKPDGSLNPLYEYHACHDHYHFQGFASYRLLDAQERTVATGRKVSFCLEDVAPWSSLAPEEPRYSCEEQGIQAGWSDIYDAGLPGQWIDVTRVPPGEYTLEVTIDPDELLDEAEYGNNTARIPVSL